MKLPELVLPEIQLPFDIPALLHPPIVHFVIAIPAVVLIIEIVNLAFKKRAIGVLSFFLLLLGMTMAVLAYLTGTVDGKEVFDTLSQAGQSELKEHKLLGIYLVLFSAVVVLLKLISSAIRGKVSKAIYLLILVLFIAGILKQGKEGGELVYVYGAHVEAVSAAKDQLDECQDDLDDIKETSSGVSKAVNKPIKSTEASKSAKALQKSKPPVVSDIETSAKNLSKSINEKRETIGKNSVAEGADKKSSLVPEVSKAEEE